MSTAVVNPVQTGVTNQPSHFTSVYEVGDSLKLLKELPNDSIDHCITSPPYFSLCDYQVESQIGLEESIPEYLSNISMVFTEVLRVLKDGGVMFLVIGDTSNNYSPIRCKGDRRSSQFSKRRKLQPGYVEKEKLGIPFLVRNSLRGVGWKVRSELIWNKGGSGQICNSDAPPQTHEYIFQLFKTKNNSRPQLRCKPNAFTSSVIDCGVASDPVHPCPLPRKLVTTLMESLDGSSIIDPFAGSGTVSLVAKELGWQHAISFDLKPEYRDRALELLDAL